MFKKLLRKKGGAKPETRVISAVEVAAPPPAAPAAPPVLNALDRLGEVGAVMLSSEHVRALNVLHKAMHEAWPQYHSASLANRAHQVGGTQGSTTQAYCVQVDDLLMKRHALLERKIALELQRAKQFTQQNNKRGEAAVQAQLFRRKPTRLYMMDGRAAKGRSMCVLAGALAALRKKRMFEQQLEQVQASMERVAEQQLGLEGVRATAETVAALRTSAAASKAAMSEINVGHVDQVLEEIADSSDQMRQMQDALGMPLGPAADLDEDELEAELQVGKKRHAAVLGTACDGSWWWLGCAMLPLARSCVLGGLQGSWLLQHGAAARLSQTPHRSSSQQCYRQIFAVPHSCIFCSQRTLQELEAAQLDETKLQLPAAKVPAAATRPAAVPALPATPAARPQAAAPRSAEEAELEALQAEMAA
jgi:hypothetical protein